MSLLHCSRDWKSYCLYYCVLSRNYNNPVLTTPMWRSFAAARQLTSPSLNTRLYCQAHWIRCTVVQQTPAIMESPWNEIFSGIVGVQRAALKGFYQITSCNCAWLDFPKLWLHFWKGSLKGCPVKVTPWTWLLFVVILIFCLCSLS